MTRLGFAIGMGVVTVLALAACPSDGEDDRGGGGGGSIHDHPTWLVGGWDHDEGREGYANYADYSIDFDADGTYVWTYAVSILDGTWRYSTIGDLVLDGEYHRLPVTKACRVIGLDGRWYLSRAAKATGCPTTPAPLSAVEKCVVGTFTSGTPNGGEFKLVFDADRTMVEHYDDPGYTSGGSSYTRAGEWRLLANGDIEMKMPQADAEVRASAEGIIGMRRAGTVMPGCDMAAFNKAGNVNTCDLTCASGRVCAEYENRESCCPSGAPNVCPDLHWCFADEAERDNVCATSYYGDPDFTCNAGQTAKSFQGLVGNYCAPSCAGGTTCPVDVDGDRGTCATAGYCFLACSDFGVTGGQCPSTMTCVSYSSGTAGLCLYQ